MFLIKVYWATIWNDQIFMSFCMLHENRPKVFYYMYRPPIEGEVTSQRWISINAPPDCEYYTHSETSLLI